MKVQLTVGFADGRVSTIDLADDSPCFHGMELSDRDRERLVKDIIRNREMLAVWGDDGTTQYVNMDQAESVVWEDLS